MLHIASRQALDEVTAEVVGVAKSLSEADLHKLGTELLQISGVLRAEHTLRRTLSESTTGEQARTGLVTSILSGKVGTTTLAVISSAVRRAWASGADLRDGVERLGRTALFLAADRSGSLNQVEEELFRFGRIIDANPELSIALDDPTAPPAGRAALITQLLDGKAQPITVALLADLATASGTRTFSHGVSELVDQAAERKNEVPAFAQTAVELDASQVTRLAAALGKIYGRPVALHVEVVPDLAGGMRITVGDEVIDGSVSGRLDRIRRSLAG